MATNYSSKKIIIKVLIHKLCVIKGITLIHTFTNYEENFQNQIKGFKIVAYSFWVRFAIVITTIKSWAKMPKSWNFELSHIQGWKITIKKELPKSKSWGRRIGKKSLGVTKKNTPQKDKKNEEDEQSY